VLALTDAGSNGDLTLSVATNGITNTKLRQSAGLSVIGRALNSTGNVADVTATADGQVLASDGSSIAWTPTLVSLFKASDQAITSAGFVDITSLGFAVASNKAYAFEFYLVYQSSATAMGVLIGVNGPASPALLSASSRKPITTPGTASTDMFSEAVLSAYDTAIPLSTSEINQATNLVHTLRGVFFNGSTAGTFTPRLSKENVAGTATIKAGSFGFYRLLN